MQTALRQLEEHLLRSARECATVLGLSYSYYAAMKAGTRRMPTHVVYHVEALVSLPLDAMHSLVKKRLTTK